MTTAKRGIVLILSMAIAWGFFVIFSNALDEDPQNVDRVTAQVVEVTPVGHRNSTGYATELRVNDATFFEEFSEAPAKDTITAHRYMEKGAMTYSVENPNDLIAPAPVTTVFALLLSLLPFLVSLVILTAIFGGGGSNYTAPRPRNRSRSRG